MQRGKLRIKKFLIMTSDQVTYLEGSRAGSPPPPLLISGFLTALVTKVVFDRGSAPDPSGGAYGAPQDPKLVYGDLPLMWREGGEQGRNIVKLCISVFLHALRQASISLLRSHEPAWSMLLMSDVLLYSCSRLSCLICH